MADALNLIFNMVGLVAITVLGVWAWRFSRSAAAEQAAAATDRRAIVREIGRMRMCERDSMELSLMLTEVRRRVAELPHEFEKATNDAHWNGYAACLEDQQYGRVLPFNPR